MPLNQWGPWTPDTSDYEGTSVFNIRNVLPRGDGYGPFPDFSAYTSALPAACRGAFYAMKLDGSVLTFAGTATKLYLLNNTDFTWTDVSKGAGTYTPPTFGSQPANWQFAQFGNLVFATQANTVLQVYDLTSSSAFTDCAGSPPQAAYISVVGRFLVLSGLLSSPYRIQWSGLNATTTWTSGVNSSDFQDFPDGGIVRGVAGGDQSGVIFQDQAIRRMSYIAGSPLIFQIDRLAQDKGLYAPYSIIRAGEKIFFYAGQGFHKIEPGGVPEQIGRERVDRTFLADLDRGNLQLFMGAADPRSSRVYWAYKSVAGLIGAYDKILGYDYVLDRFFSISMTGQYLASISQSGVTLESLDALAPTPLTISAIASSPSGGPFGAGKCRLTLSGLSNGTFSISNQNFIVIYGCGGTTEANGVWSMVTGTNLWGNVDATHIDLNVNFVNAYTGGGKIGGSLDAMVLSLDSYATAVQPQFAQFSSTNVLGFMSGQNLEASIQSSEQGTDGLRLTLRGFRVITDSPTVFGSVSYRDTQAVDPIVGNEVGMSARTGRCDMMRDARYQRYSVRIPAGTNWNFCAGYEPDVTTNGSQ